MKLYQLWEHDKEGNGNSRCIAQRTEAQIKPEFRPAEIGSVVITGEDEHAIYEAVRVK